jgi:predicted transcriptional regulator
MAQYSATVRDEKTQEAVRLRAMQWSWNKIGKELGITDHTAKKWVEDEHARRAEHRGLDKEKHLAVYDAIQKEAWENVDNPELYPSVRIGYLNTIKAAEDSKVKITGAESPMKYEHKDTTEYEVVWDDLADEIARESD